MLFFQFLRSLLPFPSRRERDGLHISRRDLLRGMLRYAPLVLASVIIGATIPDLISQSLRTLLYEQGLPIGSIMSAFPITHMLCILVVGKVVDRYGPKRILVLFLPILTGTLFLYSYAHTAKEYMILRAFNGIVYALVVIALGVLVQQSIEKENPAIQKRIMGVNQGFAYLGSSLGSFYGSQHTHLWPLTNALGIFTVLLVFAWIIRETKAMTLKKLIRELLSLSVEKAKSLVDKDALKIGLPTIGISAVFLAFTTYFTIYVGGKESSKILMATIMVIGFCPLTFLPKVEEKFGYRPMMQGSILILAISLLLITVRGPFWTLLLAGILFGIGYSAGAFSMSEEIRRWVKSERRATGISTFNFLRQLGGATGVWYSDTMWGKFGPWMWLTLIPLLVASLVMVILISRKTSSKMDDYKRWLEHLREEAAYSKLYWPEEKFQYYLKMISFYEKLADSNRGWKLAPEVLVHKFHNISLALGILEIMYFQHEEMIEHLRKKKEKLSKEIDRRKLWDLKNIPYYHAEDGQAIQRYARKPLWNYEMRILELDLRCLEAVQVLKVLDPQFQGELEQEISKLKQRYPEFSRTFVCKEEQRNALVATPA